MPRLTALLCLCLTACTPHLATRTANIEPPCPDTLHDSIASTQGLAVGLNHATAILRQSHRYTAEHATLVRHEISDVLQQLSAAMAQWADGQCTESQSTLVTAAAALNEIEREIGGR